VRTAAVLALGLVVPVTSCADDARPSVRSTDVSIPASVQPITVEVREAVPHDSGAFTEGLVFDGSGRLFESTGLEGKSTLRELDPRTGEVLRSVAQEDDVFGEGLALAGDRLVQLTWRNGDAFVYDPETFDVVGTFEYEGEGWGLCFDGTRLVMSDGSDTLTFRDPTTFEAIGSIAVTMAGAKVALLNELECAGGKVYANIFHTDLIALLAPADGKVETLIDAAALARPEEADVLNGIALDPHGQLWLTGKWWDTMYMVELVRHAR
jgi:glutamine cyclotransferase